jgi:hypothetical protein
MAVQSHKEGVDPEGGRIIVWALDVGWVPRCVVDDEVHVGELARHRHYVVGTVEGRIKVHERESLVGHEDLDPEVVGVLDRGKPYSRILQRIALSRRAPGRVHLERQHLSRVSGARHLIERGAEGTDIRSDDVLHQKSTSTARSEPGQDLLGVHGLGERDRGI